AAEPLRQRPDSVVLRVDLDSFTTVSDALGYGWADRMVTAASVRIRETLGGDTPIARLEGASFGALVTGCATQDDAHAIAERLSTDLSEPYPVDRLTIEANAVVGYVSPTVEGDTQHIDVDGMLQRAAAAVRATRGGERARGCVP